MFDTLDEVLPPSVEVSASVVPYSTSVNISGYSASLSLGKTGEVWAAERMIASNGASFVINDASPSVRGIPVLNKTSSKPAARLSPLSTDIDAVRSKVNSLTADGGTAGHLGMAWGVYTLSDKWGQVWPKSPEKSGDAEKVIIILSDGEFNTIHNLTGGGSGAEKSYGYFQAACKVAKDEGILVHAVALSLDDASRQQLEKCVNMNGQVHSADSAGQLQTVFKTIALSFGQRRLTN